MWIENTRESDPRSYEATKEVEKKAQNFLNACTYDLYHIHVHIISLSSYNRNKLNSLLTDSQQGFIAQSVEHHTGITEVMGLNPFETSDFFLGFLSN